MKDSDIKAVAEALVKYCIQYSLGDTSFYCCFCTNRAVNKTDIDHKLDCQVGIAEKLLEEMK